MSDEPFIPDADRPDITVDLDKRVSEFTVRELTQILGTQGFGNPFLAGQLVAIRVNDIERS